MAPRSLSPVAEYPAATLDATHTHAALDFRLQRVKSATVAADLNHIFAAVDVGILDEQESLLDGDDFRDSAATPDLDTEAGEEASTVDTDGILHDQPSFVHAQPCHGPHTGAIHRGLRIALGLVLLSVAISGVAVVSEVGVMPILSRFQGAPWVVQGLFFTLGFYFVSLPFAWGYVFVNMLAGYMYGFWAGQAVVIVTAALGTWLGTLTLRYLAQDYVRDKVEKNKRLRALSSVVHGPNSFYIIALLRLSPFPFGLQTALFSVGDLNMGLYMLATTIGLFPLQAVNTALGSSLHSMKEILTGGKEMDALTYAVLAAQVVAGVLVTAGVLYATKIQLHKAVQEAGHVEMHAAAD